jgi:hypothetical protein
MAVVKGVKEKVHLPLYDSIVVKPREQLNKTQSSNILRFFQDVAGKTKLQTNMQAASLLPHWNTFEARAMRVVISDLTAQFPDAPTVSVEFKLSAVFVTEPGDPDADPPVESEEETRTRTVVLNNFNLRHLVDFKRRVEGPNGASLGFDKQAQLDAAGLRITENGQPTTLRETGQTIPDPDDSAIQLPVKTGEVIVIDRAVLNSAESKFEQQVSRVLPPLEQVFPNNGSGSVLGKLIYNSVTTFFVGEKTMLQVPTWFLPAGAGPYSEDGKITTHGFPSPESTFRFAEPIFIDTQQNFRVEIEIPESEVMADLQRLYGPFFIWVVLDGFMTRDVQ